MRRTLATLAVLGLAAAAPAWAAESGNQDAGDMDKSLSEAWQDAKRDWNALQDASGEAFEDAKRQFEESWRALQQAIEAEESDDSGADAGPEGTAQ